MLSDLELAEAWLRCLSTGVRTKPNDFTSKEITDLFISKVEIENIKVFVMVSLKILAMNFANIKVIIMVSMRSKRKLVIAENIFTIIKIIKPFA